MRCDAAAYPYAQVQPPGRERRGRAVRKPYLGAHLARDRLWRVRRVHVRRCPALARCRRAGARLRDRRHPREGTVARRRAGGAGAVSDWSEEHLHQDYRQSLRVDRLIYDSETDHQRLRVFENARFGRVLTLDGVVQTTEGDEFIYHEMLTHVPILAHGSARRVLIIGGGDGGMAREVLRHPDVAHVTMVEIDAGVVEFSRRYLPSLSAGAFDDPRLELVIDDGAAFMRGEGPLFDVIIVDSTDPVGPGEVLFTDTFYGHARARLAKGGILVTQNGVPFMQGGELTNTMRAFRALFSDWGCYLASIPTYAGGPMAFGWGTDGTARQTDVAELSRRMAAAALSPRYYTPEVHKAAFALPGYVARLMPTG
ncbi:MAG: polyamine aminopropyltransferase [Rhodobacteraceae bacterium]|nr:polyamine aminopropyltransferase [Paracoccaceae bacterium]